MKRALLCLACLLVVVLIGAHLSAQSAAPPAKAPEKVSLPATAAAAALPTPPAVSAPASRDPKAPAPAAPDLEGAIFLSGPPCTYYECIQGCTDCPWGHTSYCISTAHCQCGCR